MTTQPDITTAEIGDTVTQGTRCENCDMSYKECTERVLRKKNPKPCCPTCGYTDTHDAKPYYSSKPSEEAQEAFRQAWHQADDAGRTGERVTEGLEAALRYMAENPEPGEFVVIRQSDFQAIWNATASVVKPVLAHLRKIGMVS